MFVGVVRCSPSIAMGFLAAALTCAPITIDSGDRLMAQADEATARASAKAMAKSSASSKTVPGECTSEATAEATTTINGETTTKRDHDKTSGGDCSARADAEARAGSQGGAVRTDANAD